MSQSSGHPPSVPDEGVERRLVTALEARRLAVRGGSLRQTALAHQEGRGAAGAPLRGDQFVAGKAAPGRQVLADRDLR